jgi:hypothetical protein
MSSEPRQVQARRINDATLEIDIGPVVAPLGTWITTPSPVSTMVQRLDLGEFVAPTGDHLARAHLTIAARARTNVRVSGRRVYIDFMPTLAAPPQPPAPVAAAPRVDSGFSGLHPAIARFEEIEPFLLSAVAVPQAPVLRALDGSLTDLSDLMRTGGRGQNRAAQDLLASAVTEARRAVDPLFSGDRSAQAQRAITIFQEAKQHLAPAVRD